MKNSSNQTEDLFSAALELSPELRIKFLDEKCAGDRALKEKLRALIAADENVSSEDFLERSALEQNVETLAEKLFNDAWLGKEIGHYRIEEKISAWGMGAVYLASRADKQFEKRVAVKIIRRGMNSEAILQRFLLERQILANLEHPNIARLIDAGMTEDETPYFVMEYVEGVALDDFCNKKNLSLDEKLELFRRVCSAVDFAHRNLVVHRDLKPSNILITADGTPKLLDFGIAKLLDSDNAETTAAESRVLTPAYASPEQLKGGRITTATDVYSLGVILFELLTNQRPYKTDSEGDFAGYVRAVCETEPLRPSSVVSGQWSVVRNKTNRNNDGRTTSDERRQNPKSKIQNPKSLKGDLDNIILKSLRKEPERRYLSVAEFSEDVRRHQAGLPVTASRGTWNYRAQKFLARHRYGAVATGLILLALLGGLGATLYQTNVARQEKLKAERRFNDVRQLANSMIFEVNDEMEKGTTKARETLVQKALEYLDNLSAEAGGNNELQIELATAYEKVGDIQGNSFVANTGNTSGALASYQKALAIRQAAADSGATDAKSKIGLAESYERVADVFWTNNDLQEALNHFSKGIEIIEPLAQSASDDQAVQSVLANLYLKTGDVTGYPNVSNLGDTTKALDYHLKSLDIRQKLLAADAQNSKLKRMIYINHFKLTTLYQSVGDLEKSRESAGTMLKMAEEAVAAEPENARARRNLATAYNKLSGVADVENKIPEAINESRKALAIYEALAAADAKNSQAQRDLFVIDMRYGELLAKSGDVKNALAYQSKGVAIGENLVKADSSNNESLTDLAEGYNKLAETYFIGDDAENALKKFRAAHEILVELAAKDSENAYNRQQLMQSKLGISRILLGRKEIAEAFKHAQEAVALGQKFEANTNDTDVLKFIADSYLQLAQTQMQTKETRQMARASFEKSLEVLRKLSERKITNAAATQKIEEISKQLANL